MKELTLSDFEAIMERIESNNMDDFSSFKEELLEYIGNISTVDEIIEFIEKDVHVYSDLELYSLNETDWDAIVEFINCY